MMDLQYLTAAYLKRYRRRLHSAVDINYGDCYRFSYIAYQLYGGQLITITQCIRYFEDRDYERDTSHAFLKKDGKYYDSEAPTGIRDWNDLGYVRRIDKYWDDWYWEVKEHKSTLSFKRYWKFKKKQIKADEKLYRVCLDSMIRSG